MLTALSRLDFFGCIWIYDSSMKASFTFSIGSLWLIIHTLKTLKLFKCYNLIVRHVWIVKPFVSWVETE